MKVAIAGGGTGGHISPAIAVAEAIWNREPNARVDFIATPRPVDKRMYHKYADCLHIMNPPRMDRGITDVALLPFRALIEYKRARKLLKRLEPEALFATGGYSSFFPVAAARSLGIPSIIHESNSIPGRANRLAARYADETLTGFRSAVSSFRKGAVYTGNPVRLSMEKYDRDYAREKLDVPANLKVVLFLGGSQGAKAINDIAMMAPLNVFVMLQCGCSDRERIETEASDRQFIRVADFVDDPALLYSAADIAVARSGAMTIAELTWFRVPAVYVPYPFAADDHQKWNALEIKEKGGALLFDQDKSEPSEIWDSIISLLENAETASRMRESLIEIMPVNPADVIAEKVMSATGEDF